MICRPADESGITRSYQLLKTVWINFLYTQNIRLRNLLSEVPSYEVEEKNVLIISPCFLYFLEFRVWMVWRNVMKSRAFAFLGSYASSHSWSSNPRRNSTWITWIVDGTDRLYRNVSNYQSTLRNIPAERWSPLHRGGSLTSWNMIRILRHWTSHQRHTS